METQAHIKCVHIRQLDLGLRVYKHFVCVSVCKSFGFSETCFVPTPEKSYRVGTLSGTAVVKWFSDTIEHRGNGGTADTLALGANRRKPVGVQIPLPAPTLILQKFY